jgi:nitrogen regulatory protein P-II 1
MKEINAVIQPGRLERLREAFRRIPDFPGMTVVRAEGSGYHPDKPRPASIKNELKDYSARVLVRIVSEDSMAERMVEIIRQACHTGQPGDGVIWTTSVDSFERIRMAKSAT